MDKKARAIGRMFLTIFCYILSYGILNELLRGFHADACYIQMLSGSLLLYSIWKREKKKKIDFWVESGFIPFLNRAKPLLNAMLLGIGLNCFIGGLINLIPFSDKMTQSYMQASSAPVEGVAPALAFIIISFIAPLIEECLFRGVILRRLRYELDDIAAIAWTSTVFGLLHGQIIWIMYAIILGMALGLVYVLYDSIYPPIILHMSFNLVSGIPMLLNPQGAVYRWTYGNPFFLFLMMAGGFAGVITILYKIYFKSFLERTAKENGGI
ncbi:MAG: type II CAAX endopeptidase family protein [Clostridium sp.]